MSERSSLRLARTTLVVGLICCLAIGAAAARDGRIVDEQGKPIEGAESCLLSGQLAVFCSKSDAQGAFTLPDAPATGIRIQKRDYQPLELPVQLPDEPFVMERAATLMLHVVDAVTGKPIPSSNAYLRSADGRRRGPAPVNRHGLKFGTLRPGLIRIEVEADGYEQGTLGQAMLAKGKTTEVTVRLDPVGLPGKD